MYVSLCCSLNWLWISGFLISSPLPARGVTVSARSQTFSLFDLKIQIRSIPTLLAACSPLSAFVCECWDGCCRASSRGPHSERCLFCGAYGSISESTRRRVTGCVHSKFISFHFISFRKRAALFISWSNRRASRVWKPLMSSAAELEL